MAKREKDSSVLCREARRCDQHLGFADREYVSIVLIKASQISSYCGIRIYMHVNELGPKEITVFNVEQVGGKV